MVCCVVDDAAERLRDSDPNRIYERCRRKHQLAAAQPAAALCGVGRYRLALGDYQWVRADEADYTGSAEGWEGRARRAFEGFEGGGTPPDASGRRSPHHPR